MKKLLALFVLFLSVLSVRAELSVEWIDGNTIRVSGTGYTVITNTVYTNSLGTCTNCVQISPEQMHAYKTSILSECDSADSDLDGIIHSALLIYERMNQIEQDISTFRRFGNSPEIQEAGNTILPSFSNYVYTVDNNQTSLDRQHQPTTAFNSAAVARWISYNNGIYDYANFYILPDVTSSKGDAEDIVYQVDSARAHIDTIRTTVRGMSESACECQGDGAGSCPSPGGDGDCPCSDQMNAIKDYVEHIDDDFHKQLSQMSVVTNFVNQMDSYARIVSGVLYNDATIVVDDGENSWSNVYIHGESDLYLYDKSNILQRIELLLFGLTPLSSVTNFEQIGELSDSTFEELKDKSQSLKEDLADQHEDLVDDITTIKDKVEALFESLNFFGSGSLSEFSLNDPYTLDDFGGYTFEVTSHNVEELAPYRNSVRTCFQVFYWVSGISFMIFFWYLIVTFIVGKVLFFLGFLNNLLT